MARKGLDQTDTGIPCEEEHSVTESACWIEMPKFPPPMHPDKAPPEPDDAGAPRAILKPADFPPPWTYARTTQEKIKAVDDFASRIANLAEGDFGDWMRRAEMYWWHLSEALKDEPEEVHHLLEEMHVLIQFRPNFDITSTTCQAIQVALRMRERLGAKDIRDPHEVGAQIQI